MDLLQGRLGYDTASIYTKLLSNGQNISHAYQFDGKCDENIGT